jgi:hypothetical protein
MNARLSAAITVDGARSSYHLCGTRKASGRCHPVVVLPGCGANLPLQSDMGRRVVYFLIGFVVGAAVSLLWNAMPIIRAGGAPPIPGIWFDIAVQAFIIGLLLGLIVMWLGAWRRNRN